MIRNRTPHVSLEWHFPLVRLEAQRTPLLLGWYTCRSNTNTGKLTSAMIDQVLRRAKTLLG